MPRLLLRALRSLNRKPAFTVSVVVAWAIGLVAGVASLLVADALFFRPPADVRDPSRVVRVYSRTARRDSAPRLDAKFSAAQLDGIATALAPVAQVAGQAMVAGTVRSHTRLVPAQVGIVTAGYFEVMGVPAVTGRLFAMRDAAAMEGTGASPVVVSERLARALREDNVRVPGGVLRIRDQAFTIIGSTPPSFTGGDLVAADAWVLTSSGGPWVAGQEWRTMPFWWLELVARVRPAVDRAQAERHALATRWDPTAEAAAPAAPTLTLTGLEPGRSPAAIPLAHGALLTAGAGLLLLLIGATNVGSLFLMRAVDRAHDTAVERALGATTGVIAGRFAAEVGLMALAAGALATVLTVLLGTWGLPAALGVPEGVYRVGSRGVGVLLAATLASALVALALPAPMWRWLGRRTVSPSARATAGTTAVRTRDAILVTQAMVAAVLAAGALVLHHTLRQLESQNLGIRTERVVMAALDDGYAREHPREVRAVLERVVERLGREPSVAAASIASTAPFRLAMGMAVTTPGQPVPVEHPETRMPFYTAVGPSYFRVVGSTLRAGRAFTDADGVGAARVAVVNETFARTVWPGASALGRCLYLGGGYTQPCATVVGVVADTRRFKIVPEAPAMQVYAPTAQDSFALSSPPRFVFARAAGTAHEALAPVARALRAELPEGVDVTVAAMADVIEPQLGPWRRAWRLFGAYSLVAVLVTGTGLLGTVAYLARLRDRELAIRIALGATLGHTALGLARESFLKAALGATAGCVVSLLVARHYADAVFGLRGDEAGLIARAFIAILAVSAVASVLPAWRAARRPAARVLRDD